MAKPKPLRFERSNRPSPLATVEYARPLSTLSSMNTKPDSFGDPRRLSVLPEQMAHDDTEFWQRFDVAARSIGMDEESMARSPSPSRESTPVTAETDRKAKNVWLEKQRKKRRRAHMMAWGIGCGIGGLILAVAIIGWYFGTNQSPRQGSKEENDQNFDSN